MRFIYSLHLPTSLFSSSCLFFHLSLHAVSRRTLSEVRSESVSVCRQPWQPCPNWPMAWQHDCQLLSVRAVHADRQQTAPDGFFRYEKKRNKNLFSVCLSLEITFLEKLKCLLVLTSNLLLDMCVSGVDRYVFLAIYCTCVFVCKFRLMRKQEQQLFKQISPQKV